MITELIWIQYDGTHDTQPKHNQLCLIVQYEYNHNRIVTVARYNDGWWLFQDGDSGKVQIKDLWCQYPISPDLSN